VIPAGVLSFDGGSWIPWRKNFLFPVKALSRVFRGKFISALKKAFVKGKLIFPGQIADLAVEEHFLQSINRLWDKDWVVYSKAPFNGPHKVLDYLSRYTHRVAIANHRIVQVEDGLVTFQYRDRTDGDKSKSMRINAEESIRRFLLHVIPASYKRIRHFRLGMPYGTCRMCFKRLAGRAGGFRHLMKATIFGSHSLLTLKIFRRSMFPVRFYSQKCHENHMLQAIPNCRNPHYNLLRKSTG